MERNYLPKHNWAIQRAEVISALEKGLAYPLITVVAGPGYGKTSAVLEFCRTTSRKLVWMRLTPAHNDPERFWDRFSIALSYELPEMAEELSKGSFPDTLGAFRFFLERIAKDLLGGTEILVVFDNMESIDSEEVGNFIDSLINAELENLCIIVIGSKRPNPSQHFADGRYCRIGPGELRFTDNEVCALFLHYGRELEPAEARKQNEDTGGWPLALHLMASQPDAEVRAGFGETPYLQVVAELFEMKYFAAYPATLQSFLVKLSFFQNIPIRLLGAIGIEDVEEAISLLSQNIFVSYEYQQQRFYFQRMYRDFLAHKQAMLPSEVCHALYASAGIWFRQNENHQEAMDCFWQIKDYDSFMETAASIYWTKQGRDVTGLLLDRLDMLPAEYVSSNPEVAFCRGMMLLYEARIDRAKEVFLALGGSLEEVFLDGEDARMLGNTSMMLSAIALIQGSVKAKDYAEKALSLLPADEPRVHAFYPAAHGNNGVFFLPDSKPGSLERITEFIFEFAEPIERLFHKGGQAYANLFAAEASFYSGRFPEVITFGTKAMSMAKMARQHNIVASTYFLQIRTALYLGEGDKAQALMQELVEYVGSRSLTDLMGLRDCSKGLFYMRMGDYGRVPVWLANTASLPTDIPLDIGRDRTICAYCRYLQGDYQGCYTVMLELDELLAERNLWSVRIIALVLKSACLLKLGNENQAVEVFHQAYESTWQNGITVCFAEIDQVVLPLLEVVRRRDQSLFDSAWLDKVEDDVKGHAKREAIMRKQYAGAKAGHEELRGVLTPRELEVLTGLAQGFSREELETTMGISLHGVKKHITNIYNKLGAINRVDAIHIAIANGILDAEIFKE